MTILDRYVDEHPGSRRLHQRALRLFPNGVTHDIRHHAPFPLYVERAAGSRKWDVDGNEIIDYFGGHGALLRAGAPLVHGLAGDALGEADVLGRLPHGDAERLYSRLKRQNRTLERQPTLFRPRLHAEILEPVVPIARPVFRRQKRVLQQRIDIARRRDRGEMRATDWLDRVRHHRGLVVVLGIVTPHDALQFRELAHHVGEQIGLT